jgi:beta-glucosidase
LTGSRSRRLAVVAGIVAAAAVVTPLGVSATAGAAPSVSASGGSASASAHCPWLKSGRSPNRRAHQLVAAMTLAQKISMVTGESATNARSTNSGAAGVIAAIPSLCVPALVLNDATAGVGDQQSETTAFPDSIALTAAWNPALAQRYGRTLGRESFTKGVNVMLGPGMDIARNPLNGRNFEYAGEDPYLAGTATAAIIRGIQSQHVVATAKHYALNDQETKRNTDSSDASERTMQEIDLRAFHMAVQQGHVGAVMCSYNRINNVYACQNPYTLRHVLDGQFHFNGWVMSDWGATHSTVPAARAGLDMEMPSQTYFGSALQSAVKHHQVPKRTLDQMVLRITRTMFRLGLFTHVPAEGATAAGANASTSQSIAMATKVGQSGTVLLQDRHRILPISGKGRSIAVIGSAAGPTGDDNAYQGFGSGHVTEFGYVPSVVSPLQAITSRASAAGDSVTYEDGSSTAAAAAAAKASNLAVVFVSDAEIEGADRPNYNAHSGSCSFVDVSSPTSCEYDGVNQNQLVKAVAKANPHTIVVLQSGDPIAMPWQHQVQGILDNWYPGQTDGDTIAPILFGAVDPSGKLPLTFPKKLSDDPLRSKRQYPGVPNKAGVPQSHYSEGLLVGYRWYDARHIAPRFPFGFGLSYTHFHFSYLAVAPAGGGAKVRVTVANVGKRAGSEVAQVYVGQPKAAGEPPRQLAGFRRVALKPGQSRRITVRVAPSAFQHWSTRGHRFTVTPGAYRVMVGSSSASLPLHARLVRH